MIGAHCYATTIHSLPECQTARPPPENQSHWRPETQESVATKSYLDLGPDGKK